MRLIGSSLLIAGLLVVSARAGAACNYPSRVDIPNGAQATKEEMLAGQKAIKTYMDTMNSYLDCIEAETDAAQSDDEAPEITEERRMLLAKRHNAAIDEMEKVAAEFNAQVRAYKESNEQ